MFYLLSKFLSRPLAGYRLVSAHVNGWVLRLALSRSRRVLRQQGPRLDERAERRAIRQPLTWRPPDKAIKTPAFGQKNTYGVNLALGNSLWQMLLPGFSAFQQCVELTVFSWTPVSQSIGTISFIDSLHLLIGLVIGGWRELSCIPAAHANR